MSHAAAGAIATEVLSVHRLHIDEVLETLREEMSLLSEFEKLEEEKGGDHGSLTADDVARYIDSVDACAKDRKTMLQNLRSKLRGYREETK